MKLPFLCISGGGGFRGGVLSTFLSVLGENSETPLSDELDRKFDFDDKAEEGLSGLSGFFCYKNQWKKFHCYAIKL